MLTTKKLLPLKVLIYVTILFLSVFLIAGRVNYWQGWVFCCLYSFFMFTYLYLFRNKQDLVKERIKPGPGVKWWDKIIVKALTILGVAVFVTSCFEGGRYSTSYNFPLAVYIINLLIYIINTSLCLYAMNTNIFFSSMVRIQKDRGHQVVSTGLYSIIRHPGYCFAGLSLLSLPIVLGSVWGLIPAIVSVLILIYRTNLEDKTLQLELPGYNEYAKRIKYKLIPFLW